MATINVRIDDELKQQADGVLKTLGGSPTEVITALYRYIAEKKRLPFVYDSVPKTSDDIANDIINMLCGMHHYCLSIVNAPAKSRALYQQHQNAVLRKVEGMRSTINAQVSTHPTALAACDIQIGLNAADMLYQTLRLFLKSGNETEQVEKTVEEAGLMIFSLADSQLSQGCN